MVSGIKLRTNKSFFLNSITVTLVFPSPQIVFAHKDTFLSFYSHIIFILP